MWVSSKGPEGLAGSGVMTRALLLVHWLGGSEQTLLVDFDRFRKRIAGPVPDVPARDRRELTAPSWGWREPTDGTTLLPGGCSSMLWRARFAGRAILACAEGREPPARGRRSWPGPIRFAIHGQDWQFLSRLQDDGLHTSILRRLAPGEAATCHVQTVKTTRHEVP